MLKYKNIYAICQRARSKNFPKTNINHTVQIQIEQYENFQKTADQRRLLLADTKDDDITRLYNAISISLFGNQSYSSKLRLANAFIFLEYENFLRRFVENISFENIVERTATDKAW